MGNHVKDVRQRHVSVHQTIENFHRIDSYVKVTRRTASFGLIKLSTPLVESNHFRTI